MFDDWHFRIMEDIDPYRVMDRWRLVAVNSDTDQVIYSEWVCTANWPAEIPANQLVRKAPGVLRAYLGRNTIIHAYEKPIATAE